MAFTQLIVCAAIQHKVTGVVVRGVRHGNCINFAVQNELDLSPSWDNWVCGFVDQHDLFLTREQAWKVADVAGQIRRPTGLERNYDHHRPANVGDEGLLFSENLY